MSETEARKESEILEKIKSGDKTLFKLIVEKYNPYLYKVGRSYNFSHEDTLDLVQDTFIHVFRNLEKFEGRSTFKTWIVHIMLNNCYSKGERAQFKNEFAAEPKENDTPMFFYSEKRDPSKIVHNHEIAEIIEKALAQIPLDYRLVFALREINGFNVLETSHILKISEENVKTRLSRAKKMLQEIIEHSYSPQDLFEMHISHHTKLVEKILNETVKK